MRKILDLLRWFMIFNAYSEQKECVSGVKLVSCGHIFAKTGREINRPFGRDDWLLFYVARESETFYLDSVKTAPAGSFIIFAPHEKQHHIYTGNKTAEFCYVHFKCDTLPISLLTSSVYTISESREACDIFEDILSLTLAKQPFYEKLCIYKLLYLFVLLERGVLYENFPEKENFERIAAAVSHMNKHYSANFTLEDYASMCAVSKFHFLRLFEKTVGTTPIEYRNNIRLEHAKDLIIEEKLTLEEVASTLGFSSLSYFSSAFKKKYGLSPKQYQKQNG